MKKSLPVTHRIIGSGRFLRPGMILILALLCSFTQPDRKPHLFLVGDSTMADKAVKAYPETGWGMPFKIFFDSTIVVENHAKNGRSSKSFFAEGRWNTVYNRLDSGDYVIIQFGHNDESKSKGERYSTPEEFKDNLRRYVRETREKGGRPILLTPVSRRKFNDEGKVLETHPEYSPLVKVVADELKVPFIDMDNLSRALYEKFGPEFSRMLFVHLAAGEHPNYPDGREDNTHFTELGARLIAEIVLHELIDLDLELTRHVINYDQMVKQ